MDVSYRGAHTRNFNLVPSTPLPRSQAAKKKAKEEEKAQKKKEKEEKRQAEKADKKQGLEDAVANAAEGSEEKKAAEEALEEYHAKEEKKLFKKNMARCEELRARSTRPTTLVLLLSRVHPPV